MIDVNCFFFQKKLNGYKFPVYSTKHCPRNQADWNERSIAINCTEENGYVCLPNENITVLLEFCYIHPFILIQEGKYTEHKFLFFLNVWQVMQNNSKHKFNQFRLFWHNVKLKLCIFADKWYLPYVIFIFKNVLKIFK